MSNQQSTLFMIFGILVAVALIALLVKIRRRPDHLGNLRARFNHGSAIDHAEMVDSGENSIEIADSELEALLEIEHSLLAVKELYVKRLISAKKYVDETRLIALKKNKY
jgi:hypothetical protein